MARILNDLQCTMIKRLNKQFEPYAKKGWMCEGSDVFGLCNAIFNNDTDEVFWADYNGNILRNLCSTTPLSELKAMAQIQGAISKI